MVGQEKKKKFFFPLFTFLNIDIWHQCIDNIPQDEIWRYIVVLIFSHTPNQRGTLLVTQHPAHCQEVSAAAVLLKKAEEIWSVHQTPKQLLQMYSGEHPDQLHHSVVWKLHSTGKEGSPTCDKTRT